jgi:hypothetical protein
VGQSEFGDRRYRARGKLLEAFPEDSALRIISPVRAAVSGLPAGGRRWSAVRIVSSAPVSPSSCMSLKPGSCPATRMLLMPGR